MIVDYKMTLVTDESGDATQSISCSSGRIVKVSVDLSDCAATSDLVLKGVETPSGVDDTYLTLTNSQATAHYPLDVASYKADGTASGEFVPPIHAGKINATIAQGGDTKTAVVVVYIEK
jgi:hypothetical protein